MARTRRSSVNPVGVSRTTRDAIALFDDRITKMAAAYPAQAALLAVCHARDYDDDKIRRVIKAAAARDPLPWSLFLAKLAGVGDGVAAPGVPKINATPTPPGPLAAKPTIGAPKPAVSLGAKPAPVVPLVKPQASATPGRASFLSPRPTPPATPATATPTAPHVNGFTPEQAQRAHLSSMAVRNIREGGAHDADWRNQALGTTTEAVQSGLLSPQDDVSPTQAALRSLKGVPRAVAGWASLPVAGAVDTARAITGFGTDFKHLRGAGSDALSQFTTGLGINPIGNAGVKSLYGEIMPGYAKGLRQAAATGDNFATRVTAGALAPLYDNAELLAGGFQAGRWAKATAGAGAGVGAGAMAARAATPLSKGVNKVVNWGNGVVGTGAIGVNVANGASAEAAPSGVPGMSAANLNAYTAKQRDWSDRLTLAAHGPNTVAFQPGDNPAMQPHSVRHNDAAMADAMAAYRENFPEAAGAQQTTATKPVSSVVPAQPATAATPAPFVGPPRPATPAQSVPPAQPATAATPSPMVGPPRPVTPTGPQPMTPLTTVDKATVAKMSPAEAVTRGQRADALAKSLESVTPEQIAGMAPDQKQQYQSQVQSVVADKLVSRAKLTGEDPGETWNKAKTGGWDQTDMANIMKDPQAAASITERAQAMGTNAMTAFTSMSPTQQTFTALGIGAGLFGLATTLFGEGGIGSMLMSVLGIGAAAGGMGLFSGKGGGPLGGMGEQYGLNHIGTLLGMGGTTPTPATAPGTPQVAAQAPKPFVGPPRPPAMQAPGFSLANYGDANGDGGIDKKERQGLMASPAIKADLMKLPRDQQAQVVNAMRQGDPAFGPNLDKAKSYLATQGTGLLNDKSWMAYMKAKSMGIEPAELDALASH